MSRVRFHEEAEDEFLDAIQYYAERSRAVAARFVGEVRAGIDLLVEHPEIAPRISDNTRRKVLRRFPYSIIYSFDGDEIVILAIMRNNRRPGYWKPRTPGV